MQSVFYFPFAEKPPERRRKFSEFCFRRCPKTGARLVQLYKQLMARRDGNRRFLTTHLRSPQQGQSSRSVPQNTLGSPSTEPKNQPQTLPWWKSQPQVLKQCWKHQVLLSLTWQLTWNLSSALLLFSNFSFVWAWDWAQEPGCSWKQLPEQFLWKKLLLFSSPGAPVHPWAAAPQKSVLNSPPSQPWVYSCSCWRVWWGVVGFFWGFSLFAKVPEAQLVLKPAQVGVFHSSALQAVPLGQVNQELPGDGACAHPPKSPCPGTTWLIFPLKRGFSLSGRGQKTFFSPSKPERMVENPQE